MKLKYYQYNINTEFKQCINVFNGLLEYKALTNEGMVEYDSFNHFRHIDDLQNECIKRIAHSKRTVLNTVSGPIKRTSISDDSASDLLELEDTGETDENLGSQLQALREEERLLLEQQATMLATGASDDIALLEHLDTLRLNQIKQREVIRQQAAIARRNAREQNAEVAPPYPQLPAPPCNVHVNQLHAASSTAYGSSSIQFTL
ncbi:unnamed protein product [Leptidea sinapis]|uniref:Uncharacterized protein n=1 Tax=Leptidea sinapis TaxID=189913 RepID=A0A5E4PQY8_9NEOP|nr:unnamed protein product [Leptidea sinapis]